MKREMVVIFNAQVDEKSMGGGDKIVLNITRVLRDREVGITYVGCPEGKGMLNGYLLGVPFISLNKFKVAKFGLVFSYILRILFSYRVLLISISKDKPVLWSASDFLPDTLPGFLYKIFHPSTRWFVNVFLKARNPFRNEVHLSSDTILYFLSQQITIFLFKLAGDYVYVLSESDASYLISKGIPEYKVFKVTGGVDLEEIDAVEEQMKQYDACFIGRFHYQKGLPDLISTWTAVVDEMPKAKLAIVGWGSEKEVSSLKTTIVDGGLKDNVALLGFLDGKEKFKVMKSSRILLFPSKYESWGVVVAEAIAVGIPVIAYELPQIKDNFPDGVVWVKDFNLEEYKEAVIRILGSKDEIAKLSSGGKLIRDTLTWEYSAEVVYNKLTL